jgi:nicotinamidase/pyrazinamidase
MSFFVDFVFQMPEKSQCVLDFINDHRRRVVFPVCRAPDRMTAEKYRDSSFNFAAKARGNYIATDLTCQVIIVKPDKCCLPRLVAPVKVAAQRGKGRFVREVVSPYLYRRKGGTMPDHDQLKNTALLIIDVQNDFCPGGALEVPRGDEIIPVVNRIAPQFPYVVATRDWHPKGHISFASTHEGMEPFQTVKVGGLDQFLWPEHCVKASSGAEFHPELDLTPVHLILHKGFRQELDSYSAFFENDKTTHTGLSFVLKGLGITTVYVSGLAEDVCVFFSAREARKLGFETFLVRDAVRGVDAPEGNVEKTRKELREAGVVYVDSGSL